MISYDDYTSITSLEISLLITFLSVWFTAYYYTTLSPKTGKPDGFGTSTLISNLHSVPLCILAYLSIQQIIPESIPLCYSISFFIIDLLDAVVRKEYIWIIHAVISLVLNVATGWNVKHVKLRSVSKGFFAEASTPFLNHWKNTKTYQSFIIFFISFTLCRIIWVPHFVYSTYVIQLKGDIDWLIWPSVLFYILQLVFYIKMCGMVVNYKEKKKGEEEKKKE